MGFLLDAPLWMSGHIGRHNSLFVFIWRQNPEVDAQFAGTLEPAPPAIMAAAGQQEHDDDEQKYRGVHSDLPALPEQAGGTIGTADKAPALTPSLERKLAVAC
jgi:hypothetical protein